MSQKFYIETWGCQSGTRSARGPEGIEWEDVAGATSVRGGAGFIGNPRSAA